MAEHGGARGALDLPHLALEAVGPEGVRAIRSKRVLLVGLGGLGTAAARYLAGAGVGALTLCDFDRVDEANLGRQVLYGLPDVGRLKVEAAHDALARVNPRVTLRLLAERADPALLREQVPAHDVVLDASDNFETRRHLNQACVAARVPWVMGACVRLEGQLMSFSPGAGPCYRCVYRQVGEWAEDCEGAGVFAPVAGVVGAAMAHHALMRCLGRPIEPALSVLDAAHWEWRRLAVARDPACPVCAGV